MSVYIPFKDVLCLAAFTILFHNVSMYKYKTAAQFCQREKKF